jgi:hypothetical protein
VGERRRCGGAPGRRERELVCAAAARCAAAPVAAPAARPPPTRPPPAPPPRAQFPTKAADARGDHGRQLPTLEEEYHRVRLEQAIDQELERIARRKGGQGSSGGGK